MNALILAAGLGNRLRPITSLIPKPLLNIINRPLIEINIERLASIGVEKIGINIFYKAHLLKKFLVKSSAPVCIKEEKKLLGTGGALRNFQDLFKDGLIIHNCDVLSNINIKQAIKFHNSHKAIATLVLTKNRGTNYFQIDKSRRIIAFSKNRKNQYTYTGIAIISKKILPFLPEADCFSIVDVYEKLIQRQMMIMGYPVKEDWFNINTFEKYWQIHHDLLNKKVRLEGIAAPKKIYIDRSSEVKTKNLDGFISVQPACFISGRVSLKDTVVIARSRIDDGNFEKCLLSDRFCIRVK